ncbi:hypothetical protein M3Y98_00896900 [Aphelenchoides besseyi]|nr:hypothetical protein M3Y98_00896900 [Aphelenchoides besseyi]KAI6193050.1 hypothetical protein M3Y96_00977000 [Aphelenchoides besseyi]
MTYLTFLISIFLAALCILIYERGDEFVRLSSILLNVCFTAFLWHVDGYFERYDKRTYKTHFWLATLMFLINLLAIFCSERSKFVLGINSVHLLLILWSLSFERMKMKWIQKSRIVEFM